MTAAVDTGLAASVLAVLNTVRADLETATPRVGRVEIQAWGAFAAHRRSFVKLVAADLAHFGELPARAATETLADAVARTAARAVAEGMDLQLARGWAPEVAWQRVLVAYGLDSRRMHAYLGAVLGGDPKQATTVVPPAARKVVEAQRVDYCDEVARYGVAAAEHCATTEISKDYNPQEIRGEHGRWAKKPVTRTKVAEQDPALDVEVEPEPDRYAKTEKDRYARTEQDRYARTEKDRYARTGPDRYARTGPDRYARTADPASDDRYARAARPQLNRRLILVMTMTPTGPKTEEDVIEAEEETEATAEEHGGGFYLPSESLDRYHGRKGRQRVIDFAHVKQFFQDEADSGYAPGAAGGAKVRHARDVRSAVQGVGAEDWDDLGDVQRAVPGVELHHAHGPWDVVQGVAIDPQVWDTLVEEALPLFDAVMNDPEFAADQLYGEDLTSIAEQAGYEKDQLDAVMVKSEIARAVQCRDSGIRYDQSLLNALADHIVWRDPSLLGDKGAAFAQTLEDYGVEEKLEGAVPEVMSFNGGFADEDDDTADMTGTYYAKTSLYDSALGTFRESAPPGVVGLREVFMKPRV